jgi:hypothetical protein
VQLTQVSLHVEQVIKGAGIGERLEFFYYTFSQESQADLGIRWYTPVIGQRRIYFLRASDGYYRSVADVVDYTLRVLSGAHSRDFCSGKPVGCCIAETLLVPGEGADPELFAVRLGETASIADVFCSRATSLGLVEKLRHYPDPRVAQQADSILAAAKADGELYGRELGTMAPELEKGAINVGSAGERRVEE